jgi:hypothetical protein
MLERRDVGGHAPFVHQVLVEPRGLAMRQHIGAEIEIGVTGREHGRRVPAQIEPRQLDAIVEQQRRVRPYRGAGGHGRRLGAARQSRRSTVRPGRGPRGSMSPGQRQRRVARVVVGLEERPHIVEGGGAQVVRVADGDPVIRMIGREERRRQSATPASP